MKKKSKHTTPNRNKLAGRLLCTFLTLALVATMVPALAFGTANEVLIDSMVEFAAAEDNVPEELTGSDEANTGSGLPAAGQSISAPEVVPVTPVVEQTNDPKTGSISGFLWVDGNGTPPTGWDGLYNGAEAPLPQYPVSLYDAGNLATPLATAKTDQNGIYRFDNLPLGTYVLGLEAAVVNGTEYLLPLALTDENVFVVNQQKDPGTAYSTIIVIDENSLEATDLNAGLRLPMGIALAAAEFAVSGTASGMFDSLGAAVNFINTSSAGTYTLTVGKSDNLNAMLRIDAGRNVTLTSAGSSVFTITQKAASAGRDQLQARHFNVYGSLTIKNIILDGDNKRVGGVAAVNGGSLTMENGAVIQNCYAGNGAGVFLDNGGTFTMNGGLITSNIAEDYGGGVGALKTNTATAGSTFVMNGGTISNNECRFYGGGVCVGESSSFSMYGGEISGNSATQPASGAGGGVGVMSPGSSFTLHDGRITNNRALGNQIQMTVGGGGVFKDARSGPFVMNGGEISHNSTATINGGGGGVCILGGAFTMNGGAIYSNTSTKHGGGVYVASGAAFSMTGISGGSITGNSAPSGEGGGIYTFNYSYVANPATTSYANIGIAPGATVSANTANGFYAAPANASAFSTRATSPFDGSLLTNYNINYKYGSPSSAIIYNANGGSGADHNQTFTPSANVAIRALAATGITAPAGKSFVGWNTEADGSGTFYAENQVTLDITTTTTLYATWAYFYQITYVENFPSEGGSGTAPEDSNLYKSGSTATVLGKDTLLAQDAVFLGWNTEADATGSFYAPGAELTVSAEVTLYAVWLTSGGVSKTLSSQAGSYKNGDTISYAISYTLPASIAGITNIVFEDTYPGSLSFVATESEVSSNASPVSASLDHSTPDKATFTIDAASLALLAGRTLTATFTFTVVDANTAIQNAGTVKINGQTLGSDTEKLYKITYSANYPFGVFTEGAAPVDANLYRDGGTATVATNTGGLSANGYHFVGWNTAANGSGTFYGPGTSLSVTESRTLFAIWANSVGGVEKTILGSTQVYKVGDTITYSLAYTVPATPNYTITELVFKDEFPSSLEFVSGEVLTSVPGTSTIESVAQSSVSYTLTGAGLAALVAGTKVVANFTFEVKGAAGSFANTATVTVNGNPLTDKESLYKVTYAANYPQGAFTGGAVPVDANLYKGGATTTVAANTGGLSATGYTFVGWNTAASGNGIFYAAGAALSVAKDKTLYAVWSADAGSVSKTLQGQQSAYFFGDRVYYAITYTVPNPLNFSFNQLVISDNAPSEIWYVAGILSLNGVVIDDDPVLSGSTAAFTLSNSYLSTLKAGDVLEAYYMYEVVFPINPVTNTGTVLVNGKTLTDTEDLYKVTYAANFPSGVGSGAPFFDWYLYKRGATVSVATKSSLAAEGYFFVGWNTEPDDTGAFYAEGATLEVTENTTLYAIWSADAGSVSKTVEGAAQSYKVGDTITYDIAYTVPSPLDFTFSQLVIADNKPAGLTYSSSTLYLNGNVIAAQPVVTTSGITYTLPTSYLSSLKAHDVVTATFVFEVTGAASSIENQATVTVNGSTLTDSETLYKLTYAPNFPGGTGNGAAPGDTNLYMSGASATVATKNTLAKDGYYFVGWNTAANGSGTFYAEGRAITITENITLYAMWTASVGEVQKSVAGTKETYKTGDKITYSLTYSVPATQNYALTEIVIKDVFPASLEFICGGVLSSLDGVLVKESVLPGSVSYTLTGAGLSHLVAGSEIVATFTFRVKDATASLSNSATVSVNGEGNTVTDSEDLYRLTYASNFPGGVGTGAAPTDANLYKSGASIAVPGENTLAVAGHSFMGWNTAADGRGTFYAEGSVLNITENITLYAIWTTSIGGVEKSIVGAKETYRPGDTITYAITYTVPSPLGFTFGELVIADSNPAGLTFIAEGSSLTLNGQNTGISAHETSGVLAYSADANLLAVLKAGDVLVATFVFEITDTTASLSNTATVDVNGNALTDSEDLYKVTYVANFPSEGGSGTAPADVNLYRSGTSAAALGKNTLAAEGYRFLGWNTEVDGSGDAYVEGEPFKYAITANLELYAQWDVESYTISYDSNTGTGSMEATPATFNTNVTLTANAFTKTGYHFAGWNTATDGTGDKYTDGQSFKYDIASDGLAM
jgi:fimbrial isopeptide formation D2 family protein/uncharacterized repeat protein (TIGR02543 family)